MCWPILVERAGGLGRVVVALGRQRALEGFLECNNNNNNNITTTTTTTTTTSTTTTTTNNNNNNNNNDNNHYNVDYQY